MKQITEDYCSFEIAKLLKEKGFDEPYCNCYLLLDEGGYTEVEMSDECHQGERYDSEDSSWKFGILLLRPTLQFALKWLREVHNIHISINVGCDVDNKNYIFYIPTIVKLNNKSVEYIDPFCEDEDEFDSNEQAVEAALLYALKNLI